TVGDAVQPACQRLPLADGGGPPGKDKEGRLEGILRILFMAQDVTADAPDKAPVSFQQGGEGRLLAASREASEELCVGQFSAWNGTREMSEASQNGGKLRFGHQVHSRTTGYRYCSRNAGSGYGNFRRLPSGDETSPVM